MKNKTSYFKILTAAIICGIWITNFLLRKDPVSGQRLNDG